MSEQSDPQNVLRLTRKLGREPNLSEALHIMQWELGDLAKSCTYIAWHPDLAPAYRAEAKKALGDLLFQAEVVAQLLNTTSAQAFISGIMTVEDRVEDLEKKIDRFKYYTGGKGEITP